MVRAEHFHDFPVPVLFAHLIHGGVAGEEARQKTQRRAGAPAGVVGVHHRAGGDLRAQRVVMQVRERAALAEASGRLRERALGDLDAAVRRDDGGHLAHRHAALVMQREGGGQDVGADLVGVGSALMRADLPMCAARAVAAARAAPDLDLEALDHAKLREMIRDSHRSKAPFSKGRGKPNPKTPGRLSSDEMRY